MAKKFLLEFSLLAQSDIENIFDYTLLQWGERQQDIYKSKLNKAFTDLLEKPARGRENTQLGLRVFTVERHKIFYRMEGKTVLVLRVLHQSMDPSLHVGDAP